MDAAESAAYLRTLLAVKALQQGALDACAEDGPSPADIRLWSRFTLRSVLSGGTDRESKERRQAGDWCKLTCCWIESKGVSTKASATVARLFLTAARLVLSPVEVSLVEGTLLAGTSVVDGEVNSEETDVSDDDASRDGLHFALARGTDALTKDVLQITWDLVNPRTTHLIAAKRLDILGPLIDAALASATSSSFPSPATLTDLGTVLSSSGGPPRATAAVAAALDAVDQNPGKNTPIHTACTAPLLVYLDSAPPRATGLRKASEEELVVVFLSSVAYDMVTKLDAGIVESGYYALPLLADFAECGAYLQDPDARRAFARARDAVDAAAFTVFARQIEGTMLSYEKTATQTKGLVPIASAAAKVSGCAFTMLSDVIEPAMNVLRRQSDNGDPFRTALADLVREAFVEMGRAATAGGQKPPSKLLSRAREDLTVLLTYMAN